MKKKYIMTDRFYSLKNILANNRMLEIKSISYDKDIEIMTHPIHDTEFNFLMSNEFQIMTKGIKLITYRDLKNKL